MNTVIGPHPTLQPLPSSDGAALSKPAPGVGAVLFRVEQRHINRAEHFDCLNPVALALNERFDDGVNDWESHVGRECLTIWRSGYEWIDMETPADVLAYVEDFYQGLEVKPRGFSLMPRYVVIA